MRTYRAVNGGGPGSQGGKRPSTAGDNSTVVMTARCLENRPAYTGKGRPSTACRLLVCWYAGMLVYLYADLRGSRNVWVLRCAVDEVAGRPDRMRIRERLPRLPII